MVYEYTYHIHNLDSGPVLPVVGTRYTKRITITAVLYTTGLLYCDICGGHMVYILGVKRIYSFTTNILKMHHLVYSC